MSSMGPFRTIILQSGHPTVKTPLASSSRTRFAAQLSRKQSRSFISPSPSSSAGSSSSSSGSSSNKGRSYARYGLLAIPAIGLAFLPTLAADTAPEPDTPLDPIRQLSTAALLRSYAVYTLISLPGLVDYSPSLLHALTHSPIPYLRELTEGIVRQTFFAQFVGGETAQECLATMSSLRERRIGTMLNYSAEAEVQQGDLRAEKQAEEERLNEVFEAIDAMGEFEASLKENERGSTSFALKVTGLIDPVILGRASTTLLRLRPLTASLTPSSPKTPHFVPYPGTPQSSDAQIVARSPTAHSPGAELLALKGSVDGMGVLATDEGLREGDLEELRALWDKLVRVGQRAQEKGIPLLVDAEYAKFQPALDAYTLLLSAEFNRPPKAGSSRTTTKWNGPLIYGTYQSYLVRQPTHLLAAIRHAEENGYALGVKLVRGAYFEQERKKWVKEGREGPDPVWPNKPATDLSYNTSIQVLLSTLTAQLASPRPDLALSVIFGTHNAESCELILNGLEKAGLASESPNGMLTLRKDVEGKIGVAQLYGMKDDLTDKNASRVAFEGRPLAIKYVPYGKLSEVIPYLGRRAIENKSLMSGDEGAGAERRRLSAELWRRMWG